MVRCVPALDLTITTEQAFQTRESAAAAGELAPAGVHPVRLAAGTAAAPKSRRESWVKVPFGADSGGRPAKALEHAAARDPVQNISIGRRFTVRGRWDRAGGGEGGAVGQSAVRPGSGFLWARGGRTKKRRPFELVRMPSAKSTAREAAAAMFCTKCSRFSERQSLG